MEYIFQDELDSACFQHAYPDFKDLPRRTSADKVFYNKGFNFGKNPKYDAWLSKKSCFSGIFCI